MITTLLDAAIQASLELEPLVPSLQQPIGRAHTASREELWAELKSLVQQEMWGVLARQTAQLQRSAEAKPARWTWGGAEGPATIDVGLQSEVRALRLDLDQQRRATAELHILYSAVSVELEGCKEGLAAVENRLQLQIREKERLSEEVELLRDQLSPASPEESPPPSCASPATFESTQAEIDALSRLFLSSHPFASTTTELLNLTVGHTLILSSACFRVDSDLQLEQIAEQCDIQNPFSVWGAIEHLPAWATSREELFYQRIHTALDRGWEDPDPEEYSVALRGLLLLQRTGGRDSFSVEYRGTRELYRLMLASEPFSSTISHLLNAAVGYAITLSVGCFVVEDTKWVEEIARQCEIENPLSALRILEDLSGWAADRERRFDETMLEVLQAGADNEEADLEVFRAISSSTDTKDITTICNQRSIDAVSRLVLRSTPFTTAMSRLLKLTVAHVISLSVGCFVIEDVQWVEQIAHHCGISNPLWPLVMLDHLSAWATQREEVFEKMVFDTLEYGSRAAEADDELLGASSDPGGFQTIGDSQSGEEDYHSVAHDLAERDRTLRSCLHVNDQVRTPRYDSWWGPEVPIIHPGSPRPPSPSPIPFPLPDSTSHISTSFYTAIPVRPRVQATTPVDVFRYNFYRDEM